MSSDVTAINIGGTKIGIIGLSDIINSVKVMRLNADYSLKNKLLENTKVRNYIPPGKEDEYAEALLKSYKKSIGLPVEETLNSGPVIKILGPGCYACDRLKTDTIAILSELNIPADVEHIRNLTEITNYGIVGTPALVINEKVVLMGRTVPQGQLKKIMLVAFKKNK